MAVCFSCSSIWFGYPEHLLHFIYIAAGWHCWTRLEFLVTSWQAKTLGWEHGGVGEYIPTPFPSFMPLAPCSFIDCLPFTFPGVSWLCNTWKVARMASRLHTLSSLSFPFFKRKAESFRTPDLSSLDKALQPLQTRAHSIQQTQIC